MSALQERRGAIRGLGVNVSADQTMAAAATRLPPLKSPRGHLLDRIRSTPRTSHFVPHSSTPTSTLEVTPNYAKCPVPAPHHQQQQPTTRSTNIYTPQRYAPDLARGDQMAILEQQLRSQNTLLAQQQLLLEKLSQRQSPLPQQSQPYCATPPYTPPVKSAVQQNNVVYDATTGQYYMYAPAAQPQFNYTVTPARYDTPESVRRPSDMARQSSLTPPPSSLKSGTPMRQPKGPPAIELLIAQDGVLNFASRQTTTSRRGSSSSSSSSSSVRRPTSSNSLRSNTSLGPIEEAFPAMTV